MTAGRSSCEYGCGPRDAIHLLEGVMGQRHADGLVVGGAQDGKVLLAQQRQQPRRTCGALPESQEIFKFQEGRTACLEGGSELYGVVLCLDLQTVTDAVRERGERHVEHHGEYRIREGCIRHRLQDWGSKG